MKKITLIFIFLFSLNIYSQETEATNEKMHIFRNYETDKFYTGWLDNRAFISRLYFNKNFDIESTLKQISQNPDWDFNSVVISVDARIATEVAFYRNKYFAVGVAGAIEVLMFGDNIPKFHVYDFSGQFSPYIDLWVNGFTDLNMKIRIYPVYHQSTHYVDGFQGTFTKGSSYELFALNVYYYDNKGLSIYGGAEGTYNSSGNGVPLFKGHVGVDYRYPLSIKYDINLIAGFNIAAIYDDLDENNLIKEQWHPAVSTAIGVEFYRYIVSLKYMYQRGRGATTYFKNQSFLGAELSILF